MEQACSGPPMKKGRHNSEGFAEHSVVAYGRRSIFGGSNQFSPRDCVGQNWGKT